MAHPHSVFRLPIGRRRLAGRCVSTTLLAWCQVGESPVYLVTWRKQGLHVLLAQCRLFDAYVHFPGGPEEAGMVHGVEGQAQMPWPPTIRLCGVCSLQFGLTHPIWLLPLVPWVASMPELSQNMLFGVPGAPEVSSWCGIAYSRHGR